MAHECVARNVVAGDVAGVVGACHSPAPTPSYPSASTTARQSTRGLWLNRYATVPRSHALQRCRPLVPERHSQSSTGCLVSRRAVLSSWQTLLCVRRLVHCCVCGALCVATSSDRMRALRGCSRLQGIAHTDHEPWTLRGHRCIHECAGSHIAVYVLDDAEPHHLCRSTLVEQLQGAWRAAARPLPRSGGHLCTR